MCGIAGLLNYSARELPAAGPLLQAMTASLAHRGPDDEDLWSDARAGVYLGHRRLSIIDLSSRGRQPMRGHAGSRLVLNGEIYNFRQLRAEMRHYPFQSRTDTEVLLAGLEDRGFDILSRLNGMFAFAFWSPRRRQLLLARDRLGIKPLYYTTQGGVFAFASELRALLDLPWVEKALDERALQQFLTFNKLAPPGTLFAGIHKFHPGHAMVVGAGGIQSYEPFWRIAFDRRPTGDPVSSVRAALEGAVDRRMVADVPVGAFLSGGVDSSAVARLMSERTSQAVRTYTIGFDEPGYDERTHARRVASAIGAEHRERVVTQGEIADFLPAVAEVFDEPLADATSIPIYFLARLAAQDGTKVVLTGDGADELFCGYRGWMKFPRLSPWFGALRSRWNPAHWALPLAAMTLPKTSRLREILRRARRGQELFWGGAGGLKGAAKDSVLTAEFLRRLEGDPAAEHIAGVRGAFEERHPRPGRASVVDWMCFVGAHDIVPNYYLHRADRLGMAASIELRVPFLDHELVDLAFSIPADRKIENGIAKAVLKQAVRDLMPADLVDRRKQGFCVPLQEWFGRSIYRHVDDNLDRFCTDTGIFRARAVRELGVTRGIHGLWNLYFLMTWFDRWLL